MRFNRYAGGYYPAGGFFDSLKKVGGAVWKAASPIVSKVAAPLLKSVPIVGTALAAYDIAKGLGVVGGPSKAIQIQGGGAKMPALSGGGGGGAWPAAAPGVRPGRAINPRTGRPYRYMNPLNPRALRRAVRRAQSFARFARRTIQITQRVKLKKRRRR
jgi:hypothetical protein